MRKQDTAAWKRLEKKFRNLQEKKNVLLLEMRQIRELMQGIEAHRTTDRMKMRDIHMLRVQGYTLAQIAKKYGFSTERARQITYKVDKMREKGTEGFSDLPINPKINQ